MDPSGLTGERQVASRGPVEPTVEPTQGCVLKHLFSQICLVQDLGGNSHVIRFLRLTGEQIWKGGPMPCQFFDSLCPRKLVVLVLGFKAV